MEINTSRFKLLSTKHVARKTKVAAFLQKNYLQLKRQPKEVDRQEPSLTENFTILEKFYSKTVIPIKEISKMVAHAEQE